MFETNKLISLFLSYSWFAAINKTVEELQDEGIACKGYVVDISKRENVFEAAKKLKDEFGGVDILINNAGIVCCKPLWDLPEKVIENTYNVNILSHYWVNIYSERTNIPIICLLSAYLLLSVFLVRNKTKR